MQPSPFTQQIVDDILAELHSAIYKHPNWPTDPLHAFAVVQEEAGELCRAILQATYEPKKQVSVEDIRAEAIQTAAMCIRFIGNLKRYNFPATEGITP